jgi:deazaflavin-dependent oxidoreductase (nitroreductase family)
MSDDSSAVIREARRDWVTEHREKYLRSGGAEGHIEDLTPVNGHPFATHLLLKYTGRKSGKVYITPLCYGDIGGEVVIIASKGGADHHPEWYLNLREMREVEFQIATQAFRGTWREPQGAERDKIWAFMVDSFPFYASYQQATSRVIPVVALKANANDAIPVFKESDASGIRQF